MKKNRPTRDWIKSQFAKMAQELGETPGLRSFCAAVRITEGDFLCQWPGTGELAKELGLEPRGLQALTPESEMFEGLARICLYYKKDKKLPSTKRITFACRNLELKNQLKLRTEKVYLDRFDGGVRVLHQRFRSWLEASERADYREILSYEGWKDVEPSRPAKIRESPGINEATSRFDWPFLPVGLRDLTEMAAGADRNRSREESAQDALDFERLCGDAFQSLGFKVKRLGQGHKRAGDFLAYTPRDRFGMIVDAKLRSQGYVLGTDDRAFREYAERHCSELADMGIERNYFAVISSGFNQADRAKIKQALRSTNFKEVSFITASGLMHLVHQSIQSRYDFKLSELENLLLINPLIDESVPIRLNSAHI